MCRTGCYEPPRKPDDEDNRHGVRRFQSGRSFAGRLGPQGADHRRDGDAGPDGDPGRIWGLQAAEGRPDHRLAAHDDPDRRADRDAERPRRRGALGLVQHLLDAGPRRRRHRQGRHARVRREGREPRGVLGLHRQDLPVAGWQADQHDPRRWRRRHDVHPDRRARRSGRDRADRERRTRKKRSTSSSRSRNALPPRPAGSPSSATRSRA